MEKFKKGDKVYIADDSQYYDQGLKSGSKMLGTVTADTDAFLVDGWYYVQWENGDVNSYKDKDLIHAMEPTTKTTTTSQNGFEVGETVECCDWGMGMGQDQIGKLFTIVEFGDHVGDPGVKLKYKSNGKIFSNSIYNDFVDIRSIRKLKQSTSEPEEEVSFTVGGETLRYHLETKYYTYPIGNNGKIFELLGMDDYEKRKFCSEAYGYGEGGGDWPTWKSGDKLAPIKIVKAIREEIAKQQQKRAGIVGMPVESTPDYDAILAEAKRRYPINTKYTPLHRNGQHRSDVQISSRECRWVYDDSKRCGIDCGIGYVYILENDTWAEVITESFAHERDSILEEAKRRYPIGVKYKSLNSDGKIQGGEPSKTIRDCRWVSEDSIDCGWGYVYANGNWAEVVGEKAINYDSILAEAKRRYPVGVKYRPLCSSGTKWSDDYISTFECKWYRRKISGDSYDGIDCGQGLVYWNGKWAEVVCELSITSGDGLLAEAKRRYPVGTKYQCAAHPARADYTYTVTSQDFSMPDPLTVFGEDSKGCLYYKGKWAEVVNEHSLLSDEFKPKIHMADRYSTSGIDINSYAKGCIIGSEVIGSSGKSLPEHQTAIILPKKEKKSKISVI